MLNSSCHYHPEILWEHKVEDFPVVTVGQELTSRYEPRENLDIKAMMRFRRTKVTRRSLENEGLLCTLSKRWEGERSHNHMAGVNSKSLRQGMYTASFTAHKQLIKKSWLRKKALGTRSSGSYYSILSPPAFTSQILTQASLSTQWKTWSAYKGTDVKKPLS